MSARISPQSDVLQGTNPDGNAQDVKMSRLGALNTEDLSVHDILCLILFELKKQTMHFEMITDNEFSADDADEEEVCE
jgi:hypothetical protein